MSIQALTSYSYYPARKTNIMTSPEVNKENMQQVISKVSEFIKNRPYPGDLSIDSYGWITDTALLLDELYSPSFIFLSYANTYYASLYTPSQQLEWDKHQEQLFLEIDRFIHQTDFIPIIIGTGGTCSKQGEIDLSYLEGKSILWPSLLYASVYGATAKDLKLLKKDKGIQLLIPRERLQALSEEANEVLPDYFLIARRGYTFVNKNSGPIYRVNAREAYIPAVAPEKVNGVSQIYKLIKSLLAKKKRVALILLEGLSCEDFIWEYQEISNTYSWFTYLPEEFQYFTLTTGLNVPDFHMFSKVFFNQLSFDKYLSEILPEGRAIGRKIGIKSAAAGSRRILTRIASGADIVVEGG